MSDDVTFDFLKEPKDGIAELLVAPENYERIERILKEAGIRTILKIEDVQK